jgi:hypothetical protein
MAARMNRQGELLQTLATLAIGTLASSIARDEIGPGSVALLSTEALVDVRVGWRPRANRLANLIAKAPLL